MIAIAHVQQVIRFYPQARLKLRELRDILAAHLSRQDRELFRQLSDYYAGDRKNIKMLEFLEHDLKDIKIEYLGFLDKHDGDSGNRRAWSFPRDFTDFTRTVMTRIQVEEEYLLPLLEGMKR